MSYCKFLQVICSNGHYDEYDESMFDDYIACNYCGEKFTWENSVDNSNGFEYGFIDVDTLFLEKEDAKETCGHCGHCKTLNYKTYNFPNEIAKNRLYYCYRWKPFFNGGKIYFPWLQHPIEPSISSERDNVGLYIGYAEEFNFSYKADSHKKIIDALLEHSKFFYKLYCASQNKLTVEEKEFIKKNCAYKRD